MPVPSFSATRSAAAPIDTSAVRDWPLASSSAEPAWVGTVSADAVDTVATAGEARRSRDAEQLDGAG
ncbi:MAG: hypothetical protein QOE44_417 [Solirubrobacteraceae bacterium]|nr:hypothetical protein [Solirubrobacteraceae bacterium]